MTRGFSRRFPHPRVPLDPLYGLHLLVFVQAVYQTHHVGRDDRRSARVVHAQIAETVMLNEATSIVSGRPTARAKREALAACLRLSWWTGKRLPPGFLIELPAAGTAGERIRP